MQPGFINGITVPLWSTIAEVMPSMHEFVQGAKENSHLWDEYEETEEDKKSYTKKKIDIPSSSSE